MILNLRKRRRIIATSIPATGVKTVKAIFVPFTNIADRPNCPSIGQCSLPARRRLTKSVPRRPVVRTLRRALQVALYRHLRLFLRRRRLRPIPPRLFRRGLFPRLRTVYIPLRRLCNQTLCRRIRMRPPSEGLASPTNRFNLIQRMRRTPRPSPLASSMSRKRPRSLPLFQTS